MIGRPMLVEAQKRDGARSRFLVEVRRSDFSRLATGEWIEGSDEDIATRGVDPRAVIAVIRNRVRAYLEDGERLTGRNCGFFRDQDDVLRFLDTEWNADVLAAVEV